MELPRKEKIISLLKENPDGISIEKIKEKLNCSSKDVRNSLYLIKKSIKVTSKNNLYSINDIDFVKTPIRSTTIRSTTILDILRKSPDGISVADLMQMTNLKKSNITGRICYLRGKGYKIITYDGAYKLIEKDTPPKSNSQDFAGNQKPSSNKQNISSDLIPKKYQEIFRSLSDNDKMDCIDMLGKSIYYHRSALSLLESRDTISSFIASMGERI